MPIHNQTLVFFGKLSRQGPSQKFNACLGAFGVCHVTAIGTLAPTNRWAWHTRRSFPAVLWSSQWRAMFGHVSGMGQNLVPLANIKIAEIYGCSSPIKWCLWVLIDSQMAFCMAISWKFHRDSWYSWSAILCGKFNGLLAFELLSGSISGYSPTNIVISSKKNREKWDEYGWILLIPLNLQIICDMCIDACFFLLATGTLVASGVFGFFWGGWGPG